VNVVQTLAAMGCFRIWIGSESGSQRVLDSMRRRTNVERVRAVVHLLQQHGIEAGLFIMLGYDGEELTDLDATVEHLKRTGADHFLTTLAYPIKGTPFYQRVEKRLVATKAWAEGSDRDLSIAGRRSRRFYDFATRWMVNEVAAHRQRTSREIYSVAHLRALANAGIGKMGMWLTQHERERGSATERARHP
jgi:anaerobic magnesium-protoporphyrin IX monomethyl ester cyclase